MEKIKLLLYCTKQQPYLVSYNNTNEHWYLLREIEKKPFPQLNSYNGKIVAECDFEVEEIRADWGSNHIGNIEIDDRYDYYVNSLKDEYELCKKSCLTMEELDDYLKGKNGYAIHIKNLNIFDKPRELKNSGYKVRDRKNDKEMQIFKVDEWQPIAFKYIEKAPQNMCKVYRLNDNEEEYDEYILISIRPEYLVRILNKEKTIEVRKRILKEMVK